MQKTWRASDIVIALLLAMVVFMMVLQMNQADRNYERLVTALQNAPRSAQAPIPGAGQSGGGTVPATEKLGDQLIRYFNSEPQTLNPITSKDHYASIVHSYMYDSLIERDPDTLAWYGKMAESWTVAEDKMTLTFKMRDGMQWSDGQPITAQDVVFSYKTIMDPTIDASRLAGYYRDIESVKAVDRLTVEFKYRQPYFLSLELCGGIPIVPEHVLKYTDGKKFNEIRGDKAEQLVYSGPYVFEAWKPAEEIVMKRNTRYFGKPGHFDKVVFRLVKDETVAYQRTRAQEIDRFAPTPEQYVNSDKDEKLLANYKRLIYPAPNGYKYIAWNNRSALFQDKQVRIAMTELIPRERICKDIYHGLAEVVTGPFWPGSEKVDVPLQSDKTIKPWPYDPADALRRLSAAGWRDTNGDGLLDKDGRPLKFELLMPSGIQVYIDTASVIREELGKVGIKVDVQQREWTVFVGKLDSREYEAIMLAWSGGVEGDPYQIWHSSSIANMGSNHVGFKNDEADRLMDAARIEFDSVKRNELYHKFHRLLHEEQPYTFLFTEKSRAFVHKRFDGVVIHNLGLEDKDWWTPPGKRLYVK